MFDKYCDNAAFGSVDKSSFAEPHEMNVGDGGLVLPFLEFICLFIYFKCMTEQHMNNLHPEIPGTKLNSKLKSIWSRKIEEYKYTESSLW